MSSNCSKCNKAVTDQDFSTSNFIIGAGISHKNCPKQQKADYGLWENQFVSTESQYSHQSAGACTINALETAIRLQLGEKPSIALINNVCTTSPVCHQHILFLYCIPYIPKINKRCSYWHHYTNHQCIRESAMSYLM